jgi:phosphate-selective porin OprO/OprP
MATVVAAAAAPAPLTEQEVRELRERLDKLEKQVEATRVATESKPAADAAKPAGGDMKPVWDNGLWFRTPDKDFNIHLGGRIHADSVWWRQPVYLKGPPPGNGGIPNSNPGDGVGPLDDGFFFRRVRIRADGTVSQHVEFMFEYDFENLNQIAFDHMWVGLKDLPVINTIRIGQMKVPQGLDMMGNDYHLTFLERSALSDAFWTLFAPGVEIANTYFDQHMTTQSMFHRAATNQPYNGSDFGDGAYAFTTRVTGTPVWECDGRYMVHLGANYQWRRGEPGRNAGGTGSAFADTQNVVRFRDRPELRDAVGTGGNSARFTDTGWLITDGVSTMGPEFMTIWGPFSVQAEATCSFVDGARQVYPAADFNKARGTPMFWGGYVQTSYFLTGENRGYDRRFGYFDRPKILNPFRWYCGDNIIQCGAWEMAYRFSYTDLNDNGISGGLLYEHTVGLNWYLQDNLKLQFNYLNIRRDVIEPANSGTVHALGMRAAFYF